MFTQVIFLLILSSISGFTVGSGDWDYGKHGPDIWKDTYPQCGGEGQSPINIQTACTEQKDFPPFEFTSSHGEQLNFLLKNNGHTIKAETNAELFLTGGDLNGNYSFDSFHLHWGPNYNTGSEHQVNGDKYAGESHFVYKHEELNQFAVLSFLMESQTVTVDRTYLIDRFYDVNVEKQWIKYFDEAQKLTQGNDSTTINLTLSSLMGENLSDFWRYNGSLTTPPCTQNVIWTVFRRPILILNYEFEGFRDYLFFQSFRGPQPLYERSVFQSFNEKTDTPIPEQKCCLKAPKSEMSLTVTNNGFLHVFCLVFAYFFIHYSARFD